MTRHYLNLGDTTYNQPVGERGAGVTLELDSVGNELGVKVTAHRDQHRLWIGELTADEAQSLGTLLLIYARAAQQDGEVL